MSIEPASASYLAAKANEQQERPLSQVLHRTAALRDSHENRVPGQVSGKSRKQNFCPSWCVAPAAPALSSLFRRDGLTLTLDLPLPISACIPLLSPAVLCCCICCSSALQPPTKAKGGRMMSLINYRLKITLNDGRQLIGQMLAFDNHMNLVLAESECSLQLLPWSRKVSRTTRTAGPALTLSHFSLHDHVHSRGVPPRQARREEGLWESEGGRGG